MEHFKLVLPGHLNHYGYLFGGNMLKWVDEISWISATRDYPGCKFVTVAMDKVEFRRGVQEGSVLRFVVEQVHRGTTSVQYSVQVFCDELDTGREEAVFATKVSFVCLDAEGGKRPLAG